MKIVKVVLSVLIVLTVVFLGTGLIIKENSYSVEITINKPLSEIFQKFNNQDSIHEWIPEITNIESIDEKPGVTGSQYRITMENEGQIMTKKEKILAFVENQKVTQYFDAEGVVKIDDYTFISDGQNTKVVLNASYQGKSYILNCIFPYFKGAFKSIDKKNLSNFKVFAERQ